MATNSSGDSASDFLVAEDPDKPSTWHLQVKRGGKPDHRLMGAAWAALHGGYRGNKYEGPNADEALSKLTALYKSEGLDTPKSASEPQSFDQPDVGDVHVNGPMGGAGGTPTKSPLLGRLVKRIRQHLQRNGYMDATAFEQHYRSALGHAGGVARASKMAEPAMTPGDWEVCPSCAAGGGPGPSCDCPACMEGDPEDCLCQEIQDDESDGQKPVSQDYREPRVAHEPGNGHIDSGSGESFRLFVETQQFADPPEWIPLLPKPGVYKHPRYGEIDMSAEQNASFVRNFNAGVYQTRVPIDAEHESKLSGALGWLTEARQNPDGTADGRVEWTDRGRTLVAADRFKFVSPEWYSAWVAPDTGQEHQNVLIGAALTNRPFYKEGSLRPLVASEKGIYVPDEDAAPVAASTPTDTPVIHPRSNNMADTDDAQRFKDMEAKIANLEAENASLKATEPPKDFAEMSQRFAELEAERDSLKQASMQATERVAALETENRRKQFAETARGWHGETAKHVEFMEQLPTDEARKFYAEQQSAYAEQLKQSKLFTAMGTDGVAAEDTALGQAQALADAKRAEDPKLSAPKAMTLVFSERPELYERYLQENSQA